MHSTINKNFTSDKSPRQPRLPCHCVHDLCIWNGSWFWFPFRFRDFGTCLFSKSFTRIEKFRKVNKIRIVAIEWNTFRGCVNKSKCKQKWAKCGVFSPWRHTNLVGLVARWMAKLGAPRTAHTHIDRPSPSIVGHSCLHALAFPFEKRQWKSNSQPTSS